MEVCQTALVFFICSISFVVCAEPHYEDDECSVWTSISNYIMQRDAMNVQCSRNSRCTGVDCSGMYSMSGGPFNNVLQEELCFGILIHPCATTPELSVYIELLKPTKSSFHKIFTGNDSAIIPGSTIDLQPAGQFTGFLNVTLQPNTVKGKNYILAGVCTSFRADMFGMEYWPPQSQMTLIPDVNIPIPPCDQSVSNPEHQPGTCHADFTTPKPSKGSTGKQSHHTSVPKTPAPQVQKLPGTKCKVDYIECGNHEMCSPDNATATVGRCVCAPDYQYDPFTRTCTLTNMPPSTTFKTFPYPHEDEKKPINKKVLIIAVCSVVGVLVVAGIMVAVVVRHRQLRARYANHQPLATEDFQDDDDEPLVI